MIPFILFTDLSPKNLRPNFLCDPELQILRKKPLNRIQTPSVQAFNHYQ